MRQGLNETTTFNQNTFDLKTIQLRKSKIVHFLWWNLLQTFEKRNKGLSRLNGLGSNFVTGCDCDRVCVWLRERETCMYLQLAWKIYCYVSSNTHGGRVSLHLPPFDGRSSPLRPEPARLQISLALYNSFMLPPPPSTTTSPYSFSPFFTLLWNLKITFFVFGKTQKYIFCHPLHSQNLPLSVSIFLRSMTN